MRTKGRRAEWFCVEGTKEGEKRGGGRLKGERDAGNGTPRQLGLQTEAQTRRRIFRYRPMNIPSLISLTLLSNCPATPRNPPTLCQACSGLSASISDLRPAQLRRRRKRLRAGAAHRVLLLARSRSFRARKVYRRPSLATTRSLFLIARRPCLLWKVSSFPDNNPVSDRARLPRHTPSHRRHEQPRTLHLGEAL